MAGQQQYLEWHGQQWRVRVKVPTRLREVIGRGKLVHPLHTADLKEANARKWVHVARLKAIIAAYEKAVTTEDPEVRAALLLRLSKDDEDTQYEIDTVAEQIEKTSGLRRAKGFAGLASGSITPLDHHADAFAQHRGYRLKSEGDFKRALGWFRDWLRDSDLPIALEGPQGWSRGASYRKALQWEGAPRRPPRILASSANTGHG